jgi:acyl dehydratase
MSASIENRANQNLAYEDVVVGAAYTSAPHTVTPEDIAGFARLTRDHHPLHLDERYARGRGFPAVIAHGLFGLSLMEGLKAEMKLYEHTSIASLGWDEVRFTAPVLAGDTVRVRFRFAEKRPSRKPDRGVVIEDLALVNQRDEAVITARHASLVLTRHGVCSSPTGDAA